MKNLPYTIRIETITPELAKKYLKNNIERNRRLRPRIVEKYARDILNGNWYSEGVDPICISPDGKLLNGQHRMNAVIKANKAVEMLVARGVDERLMEVMDRCAPRTTQDVIAIGGRSISPNITAIVRAHLYYRDGNKVPSDHEIIEYIDSNIDMLKKAEAMSTRKGPVCRKAAIAYVIYAALKTRSVSEEVLEEFCEVANSGFMNEPWQRTPIMLRQAAEISNGTSKQRHELTLIAEAALKDFAKKNQRLRKYNPEKLEHSFIKSLVDMEKIEKLSTSGEAENIFNLFIADTVRKAREKKHLSRRDLAKMVGIPGITYIEVGNFEDKTDMVEHDVRDRMLSVLGENPVTAKERAKAMVVKMYPVLSGTSELDLICV